MNSEPFRREPPENQQERKQTKEKERNMKVQNTVIESTSGRVFLYAKRVALSGPGKLLLAAAAMIGLVSVPLLTRADDQKEDLTLEGSWINTVSPILPPGAPPITFV